MHKSYKGRSWQPGETECGEVLYEGQEEPSASKLRGLHAKTTLSVPVAQLMDNSHSYLGERGGTSLDSITITYLLESYVQISPKAVVLYGEVILSPRAHVNI